MNKGKVSLTQFESEMNSAIDVMFAKWMETKEPKVRFAIVESLGFMCHLLERNTYEMRLVKLLPTYLNMYKGVPVHEQLPISSGFCNLLTVGTKDGANSLENHLITIMSGIHPMVCRPPDFANPNAMKNYNEVLRMFEILGRAYLDNVLHFIISRFQLKDPAVRIGSLVLLRHFVQSIDHLLEDKKPLIMSSVINLVNEDDLAVRKAIMQLIVAMSNADYLTLEGGQTLVRFIARQSAINVKDDAPADGKERKGPDTGALQQLRNAGNHILHVMATKVPSTHPVLWPFLLELFNDPAFTPAMSVLTGCVHALAAVKRESNDPSYNIDFEVQVNIPKPQVLLSRLMILASVPTRQRGLGLNVVNAMGALGPLIHPAIGQYWDQSVPSLVAHLESHPDASLNVTKWQDSLLRMWKETIAVIDKPTWLHDLCATLHEQFKLYAKDAELQRVVHRFLGHLLARIDAKTLITDSIDLMLRQVNHNDDIERQGCAQGLGLASAKHLDVVLPKLNEMLATLEKKQSSGGWFSSSKDTGTANDAKKSTIILAYGFVAAYADSQLILSRLDVHVLHNLMPVMTSAKTVLLKINIIKALDLIGKALHVTRLPEGRKNFHLKERDKLVTGLTAFLDSKVKTEHKPSSDVRLLGLAAASTLVNLEPALPMMSIREKLLDAVLPYIALYTDEKETKGEDGDVGEALMNNLNSLLASAIHMQPTVPSLIDILKRLEKYLPASNIVERDRACTAYLNLLKKFIAKAVHEKCPQEEKALPELGHLVAALIPRCSDASVTIRQTAAESVQALLYINQILGNPDNPRPAQEIKLITDIRNRLEPATLAEREHVVRDIAAILTSVLSIEEQIFLLKDITAAFVDPEEESAVGAAEVARGILERQGKEFLSALVPLVGGIVESVKKITRPVVTASVLSSFRVLAKLHFEPVLTQLLSVPVPLPKEVIESYVSLVSDPADAELAHATIRHLYNTLNETPIIADKPTPIVQTATSALAEIVSVPVAQRAVAENYPAVFCSLLMRCGTAQGVDKPSPADKDKGGERAPSSSADAIRALRAFLQGQDEKEIISELEKEGSFAGLETKTYDDAVTIVTRVVCTVHPDKKRHLLSFLSKFYSQQSYVGQRIVATSMLAQFVVHSKDDDALLRELIKFLLPRVVDKVEKVRKQALRGLGNLVHVWNDDTATAATSVLSSLMTASEDTNSEVAAEAVSSLTRISQMVDHNTIGPMLINICFRLRPSFDRNEAVRTAAFTLFGELCRFGAEERADSGLIANFIDQVHTNVPIFLAHVNDEEAKVRAACILGLRKVAALLGEDILKIVEERDPNADVSTYDDFLTAMSVALVKRYPDRLRNYLDGTISYFTSTWHVIRANAATLVATLLASSTAEDRKQINVNHVVTALIGLLDKQTPEVRGKAARGLGLLKEV